MRRPQPALSQPAGMIVTVACLIFSMLPGLPAAADTQCAGERVSVADSAVPACGTISIEVADSRTMKLRVDEPTSVVTEVGPSGGMDVTAQGRLAFLAVSDSSSDLVVAAADIPAYLSLRKTLVWPSDGGAVSLDPGEYRLTLATVGGAAEAKLRFSELTGDVTYLPSAPAKALSEEPPTTPGVAAQPAVWAGDDHVLPSDGLAFFALWTRHPAHVFSEGALCAHVGAAPPPSPVAYAPGCPGTDFIMINMLLPLTEEIVTGVYGMASAGGGTSVGLGGHVTATVPASSAGAMAVWISFDDA
jgi:hypothetical protein